MQKVILEGRLTAPSLGQPQGLGAPSSSGRCLGTPRHERGPWHGITTHAPTLAHREPLSGRDVPVLTGSCSAYLNFFCL